MRWGGRIEKNGYLANNQTDGRYARDEGKALFRYLHTYLSPHLCTYIRTSYDRMDRGDNFYLYLSRYNFEIFFGLQI